MEDSRKLAILKDAAQVIKSFGFKAYICIGRTGFCWGVYTDGKTVGGFDVDGFGLVGIKTRHKPGSSGCGTGFCVKDEMLVSEITKDLCREGLLMCPAWYTGPLKGVVKYTPEEFFKEEEKKWGFTYTEI